MQPPSLGRATSRRAFHLLAAIAFVILATANSAGYRYAASDQAFYIPAVLRHLDPALFPRDAPLIDSQARLALVDEAIAVGIQSTHLSLPYAFLALYVATLVLLFGGVVRLGNMLYRSGWSALALAAAATLRHAIAKTGANSLESYFHPRQLAFAIGVWAVCLFLGRRHGLAALLVAAAAVVHPTTALWFGIWIGVALLWQHPEWRRPAVAAGLVLALAAGWMAWRGPLAGRLRVMDADWLGVIADKDYLFPFDWPLDAWFTNLIAVPIIVLCYRARRRAGTAHDHEAALVGGALALFAVFLAWLPFDAARVALAVQLQTSRVFWMLDLLAVVYLVGALTGSPRTDAARSTRRARLVAIGVLMVACTRGGYVMALHFTDRSLFTLDIGHRDWAEAMAWARASDRGSGWLADPGHSALYGSSLRAAGHRDVFLERIKDTAIAMYDRDVAMRVADRERALASMAWRTPEGARDLARRYGLDYLVLDQPMDLPLAHRAGALYLYRLR